VKEQLDRFGTMHPAWVVASIVGVSSFAVAQPLLDLVGRNPEFFVARRFPPVDIVVLPLVLVLGPTMVAIPVLLLRLVDHTAAAVAHLVVLMFFAGLFAAVVFKQIGFGGLSAWIFVTLAIAIGVGAGWSVLRFSPMRFGLRFLGAAPVVFVAVFLLVSPASDLVFASAANLPEPGSPDAPGPVVVIILDEFPTASLMRVDGSLDAAHLPALARLSDDGVWYRNMVGVRQQTEDALPSILTGIGADDDSLPIAADHPYNLFSLLGDVYDVAALEPVTELCPRYVCEDAVVPAVPAGDRWSEIGSDLSVAYRHLILPDSLAARLPAIDQGWTTFDRGGVDDFDLVERFRDQLSDDRRRSVAAFLDTIGEETEAPTLRVGHILYPHHPWDLIGDGRVHGAGPAPGRANGGWGPDPFLVAQGWQRHLIQVQYADTIVGEVIERLEAAGTYDDALIIVLADHGIAITPNVERQRVVTDDTVGSIAYVPLVVKYPSGLDAAPAGGTVDDLRAETTDILPTIADTIGVAVPWAIDGVSLLDTTARAGRTSSTMVGTRGDVVIPPGEDALFAVVAEKERWFAANDPFALAPTGWDGLAGTAVDGDDAPDVDLVIHQRGLIDSYLAGGDPVPTYLSGTLKVPDAATGEEVVAIAVDGVVTSVTRVYDAAGSTARWEAMVDPTVLDAGYTTISAWLVAGSLDAPAFTR